MSDLVKRLRSFENDHKPSGWPAIQMLEVSALLDRIEQLERILLQAREALHSCIPGDYTTGHVIHQSFDDDAIDAAIAAIDEALK